jgi:hypothetical protein
MMDIHTQREQQEEELAGLDRFLFLIQNPHFRHLEKYLKEKTFRPVDFILPKYSSGVTAVFQTAPLPPEFIEEVIRPWVEKWHEQRRGNKLEEVPQIVCTSMAMTISIPLTSGEIIITQLKME